jgi:SAM-dependent methyltransferase
MARAAFWPSSGRRRPQPQPQAQELSIVASPGTRLVLHVGCGNVGEGGLHPSYTGPEWVELRLDIDPDVEPDIVASITDMSPVPDASVDAVCSRHNIEHVSAHEVTQAIAEFFRVLRPGGEVMLATPDLQGVAKTIASGRLEDPLYESAAGPITPLDVVYGHTPQIAEGRDYMAHRTGFTRGTLTRRLGKAGFVDIRVTRKAPYELVAQARRPA